MGRHPQRLSQHAIDTHPHDQPGFIGFDMNVRHALPRGFGDDAVDEADRGRIVRAVEQIVGGRNVGGQYVQLVRADLQRSDHGRRAALHRIMVGQVPVELCGFHEANVEAARQMAAHFQQHARVAPFAHGDG